MKTLFFAAPKRLMEKGRAVAAEKASSASERGVPEPTMLEKKKGARFPT
jgi:hypothetical protein